MKRKKVGLEVNENAALEALGVLLIKDTCCFLARLLPTRTSGVDLLKNLNGELC